MELVHGVKLSKYCSADTFITRCTSDYLIHIYIGEAILTLTLDAVTILIIHSTYFYTHFADFSLC